MFWHLTRSEFDRNKGDGNRQALQAKVAAGEVPGILAYDGDRAVGWCSVMPRERFASLERSRNLRRIDEQPVWSVVCFFVAKAYRRRGLTARLLEAAAEYVRSQGGRILEGYPTRPAATQADVFIYMGVPAAFDQAGFTEVARPTPSRSIMRRTLAGSDRP